ncbi:hypothetical protein [Orientia tsutsugamushi]|uniref:hypothetical protein n=1 Tax=Orientia tsutsugamushi TaxID=784 RepID=UPI000AF1C2E1|nr:hypothetical protein [Orientia tsutsugamushi]
MQEIKLNLRPNLLRLFRYLSAIILNSLTSFERSLMKFAYNILKRKCQNHIAKTFKIK